MGTEGDGHRPSPDRLTELLRHARAAARPDGFLPFDRWMDLVLYAEGLGYYARAKSPLGPGGDFYTAPHVHPLFAAAYAERIRTVRAAVGTDRPFSIVEVGPGDGTLAAGIVSALGPHLERGHTVHIRLVERSTPLRSTALQRVRAAAGPYEVPVRVADSLAGDGPFEGVVVTNELLDALPVRRLRWDGSEWRELGVVLDGQGLRAGEGPVIDPIPGRALPDHPEPGLVFEVGAVAEAFAREVADHLVSGVWLLDDYGLEEDEIVHGHPGGTLATVRGHQSGSDALASPGELDLSVFVNWTRLRAAAGAAGLVPVADRTQAEALGAWGFPALFEDAVRHSGGAEAEVRLRLAVKNLLFGFERFRVLELAPAGTAGRFRAT